MASRTTPKAKKKAPPSKKKPTPTKKKATPTKKKATPAKKKKATPTKKKKATPTKKKSTTKKKTTTTKKAATTLRFKPVTLSTWPLFERLFLRPGAPSYCWCMGWRAEKDEVHLDKAGRKRAMHERVKRRVPIGLIGIDDDGEPQCWVSLGPKDTFRASWAPAHDGDDDEVVWAVNCFYVPRAWRGQRVIDQALVAAKHEAKKRGATVLEATPVLPSSPSYRFGGFVSTYESAEFVQIGTVGSRRHVMRFAL